MHIHSATHVMIAGSRYAVSASQRVEMLDYARRVVQRAHEKGYIVLIGDNPQGVDMAVVQECRRLKTKVIVAGIANIPRNGGCWHGTYIKVTRDLYRVAGGDLLGGYTARDRWMVDSCQRAIFVWNGDSPGTKIGYDYAMQRGKEAHLINFDRRPQLHG